MNEKILKIAKNFKFDGNIIDIIENNQGNINSTYMLVFDDGKKYLLQKINSQVMRNIDLVTQHIRKKIDAMHDTKHKTLNFIKTNNNENTYTHINRDGEKEYYRAYEYIDNCVSYNNFDECSASKEEVAYNAGKCFGFSINY